jgi:hypothetical protein
MKPCNITYRSSSLIIARLSESNKTTSQILKCAISSDCELSVPFCNLQSRRGIEFACFLNTHIHVYDRPMLRVDGISYDGFAIVYMSL